MSALDLKKVLLRLPHDAKAWIERQAARNTSSQNSEIIRCIRDRMDKGQAAERSDFALSGSAVASKRTSP
jgi:hypothetical protein